MESQSCAFSRAGMVPKWLSPWCVNFRYCLKRNLEIDYLAIFCCIPNLFFWGKVIGLVAALQLQLLDAISFINFICWKYKPSWTANCCHYMEKGMLYLVYFQRCRKPSRNCVCVKCKGTDEINLFMNITNRLCLQNEIYFIKCAFWCSDKFTIALILN